MSHIFGPVAQNGYVVPDLSSAIDGWVAAGVGPWFVYPHLDVVNFRHRGQPGSIDVSIALSNSGPLQLELIEPHDEAPSLYREFLDVCPRGGLQHLGFFRTDYDEACAEAASAGFTVGHEGSIMGGRFAYYLAEQHLGAVVEIAELDDERRRGFDVIAKVAAGWDGIDRPVRMYASPAR